MAGTDRAQAGLTSAQAAKLLEQYGKNELTSGKKGKFLRKALHILGEPMFLLLFFAAVVYFILGGTEGWGGYVHLYHRGGGD